VSVECDKHGLLGIACEECLSQRRRDTIEEAARLIDDARAEMGDYRLDNYTVSEALAEAADRIRALLGKQAGERRELPPLPDCPKCGEGRFIPCQCPPGVAPVPAESPNKRNAQELRRLVTAMGERAAKLGGNPYAPDEGTGEVEDVTPQVIDLMEALREALKPNATEGAGEVCEACNGTHWLTFSDGSQQNCNHCHRSGRTPGRSR
jgi:hypothetical protein